MMDGSVKGKTDVIHPKSDRNVKSDAKNSSNDSFNDLKKVLLQKKQRSDLLSGIRLFSFTHSRSKAKTVNSLVHMVTQKDILEKSERYLFTLGELCNLEGVLNSTSYREEFRKFLTRSAAKRKGISNPVEILIFYETIEAFLDFKTETNKENLLRARIELGRTITKNYIIPSVNFCAPITENIRIDLILLLSKSIEFLDKSQIISQLSFYNKLFIKVKNQLVRFLEANFLSDFKKTCGVVNDAPTKKLGTKVNLPKSVQELLKKDNSETLEEFSGFLKKHFADESLIFLKQVEEYKNKFEEYKMKEKELHDSLALINSKFLAEGGDLELNIPETMKLQLVKNLTCGKLEPSMFQNAENEILQLLDQNYFSKFLNQLALTSN